MSAAYELNLKMTDDETLLFNLQIDDAEGNPLVWANFNFEYSLNGEGVSIKLTDGNGISVDTVTPALIVTTPDPNFRLPVGVHRHGLRVKHVGSGVMTQLIDGTVTVSEGNFS